jgi:hypothetical protein
MCQERRERAAKVRSLLFSRSQAMPARMCSVGVLDTFCMALQMHIQ